MNQLKIFPLKIYEALFLSAALLILLSLPWFPSESYWLWQSAKGLYFLGIAFFVLDK